MRRLAALLVVAACEKDLHHPRDVEADPTDERCPDGSDLSTWYADGDGDGHGDAASAESACEAPAGTVATGDDCDDADANSFPGGVDICADGIDQDCDPERGCCPDGTDPVTWYVDADGDGHGDQDLGQASCAPAAGMVLADDDCDDADATVFPGAIDTCGDGVDQDCNELTSGCALTGDLTPADAGAELGDHSFLASFVADLDQDGAPDLLLDSHQQAGSATTVVWGPVRSSAETATALGHGASVTAADFDGDGITDVVTGYIMGGDPDDYDETDDSAGSAYLFPGPFDRVDVEATAATATFSASGSAFPEGGNGRLGDSLDAGDLNGDGAADLVIGVGYGGPSGTFAVQFGPLNGGETLLPNMDAVFSTEGPIGNCGTVPVVVGDTDGDGFADLLAAGGDDAGGEGDAWLLRGPLEVGTWALADADTVLRDDDAFDNCVALASAGDLDGDGYDDVAVGYAAGVYVERGPLGAGNVALVDADTIVTGADFCGSRLDGGVDLDGDGRSDLAIGCPTSSENAGLVTVFYGPMAAGQVTPDDADARIEGVEDQHYLGIGVSLLPDVTGDGLADLVIRASAGSDPYAASTSVTYLFPGGVRTVAP